MNDSHDPSDLVPSTPMARARRRRRRAWLFVGAALLAGLALSACGKTETATIIDGEKVERAIEASSMAQRGKRVDVSCPSGVHQKKGLTFACSADIRSGPASERVKTRFVVSQLDGAGRVHYVAR